MQSRVRQLHSKVKSLFAKWKGVWSAHRVRWLNSRAKSHFATFEEGGEIVYMNKAIALDREALELCSPNHPERCSAVEILATHLRARYDELEAITDLNEAISLRREALELSSSRHLDQATSDPFKLSCLADLLVDRHNQVGEMTNLHEAINLHHKALECLLPGHPHRFSFLIGLALALGSRYLRLGGLVDLNEAIILSREALGLCPPDHPNRTLTLHCLAVNLHSRYAQLGALTDLNDIVDLNRGALELHPPGNADRPAALTSLAAVLTDRYGRLGTILDINEAISLSREALDLCPPDNADRPEVLSCLVVSITARYEQLGSVTDLDETVGISREVLELCPPGNINANADRREALCNLASVLADRYDKLQDIADLNQAIDLSREAVEFTPPGHPDQPSALADLAGYLADRYEQIEEVTDINEAIAIGREALGFYSLGQPDRSDTLADLAQHLHTRFMRLRQEEDQEELFDIYAGLVQVQQTVSSSDLSAARRWIDAAEEFHHSTTLLAYETYLRFLTQHLATLPSLPQHLAIFKEFTSSLAADAFSACIRNKSPTRAVELLEQGRGVFWGQLTRLRSPVEDVIASCPAGKSMGEEFARLASLIRSVLNSTDPDRHDRVSCLNLEMQGVVSNIRTLPGFSHFLLPPPFSDLQRAAIVGPVIIVNASQRSCDALVILADQDPVHIPLKVTKAWVLALSLELHALTVRAKQADVMKEFGRILRELWDSVVSPIVDFLQTTRPSFSRIWWCPTAEFSRLPLHAAGPFRKGQRNLSQLYISSYTPTLTALIRARRPNISDSDPAANGKRFLAIGQANSPDQIELASVSTELSSIGQQVGRCATFTLVEGEESCIPRVTKELGKNSWVHLACHGLPNSTQPFESAFALRDGHFTIEHIIQCELESPEFAYLSACHTTVGDEESPDEVIHLASAIQFVGFRSVIGTMWAVDDGETNKITSTFYDNMIDESGNLDHTRAAYALNKTMRTSHIPLDQRILYIHLGA